MNARGHTRTGDRGFTLVELSVALLIIGTIAAMSISSGRTMIEAARQSQTQSRIASINDALSAFRKAYNRVPCPASLALAVTSANFGVEGPKAANCTDGTAGNATASNLTAGNTVAEGAVPVRTLGLPDAFAFDGWGSRIRYAATVAYVASNAFTTYALGCADPGAIQVKDASGAYRTQAALYALVSHGGNAYGAYSRAGAMIGKSLVVNTDEKKNCHCDSSGATAYDGIYVQKAATTDYTNAYNSFDDFVDYRARWQMQTALDFPCAASKYIYVADYGNSRVQKFNMSGSYISQFGSAGVGNGQFNGPDFLTADSSGNVYVGEWLGCRVQKFNSSGSYLMKFGACGTGNGQFASDGGPNGVAVDASGNIWVADGNNCRVEKFNSSGSYISQFPGDSGWCQTQGVHIDSGGSIWAGDDNAPNMSKYNTSGTLLIQFGSVGSGNGQFNTPQGFNIDASGNIWVADSINNRVQKFNNSGSYLSQFGTAGSGNGQFNQSNDIAFDSSGNMWVVDTNNNRIQKFNSSGSYLSKFGAAGSGNGQFNTVIGIAISTQ
jgi:prepilin-type N-terminal cleavage/methylation domain-containing protein